MSSPCDSCAFREGSVTYEQEPYNRFRGQIAALSGLPFFCHHGLNWRKPILTKKGIALDMDGNHQRLQTCQGWRAHVVKNITPKTPNRMIRRGLGQFCMDYLEAAIHETDPSEKAELWRDLRTAFNNLLRASKLKIMRPRR